MAGVSRLDLPARKMFANDLQQTVEVATSEMRAVTGLKCWTLKSLNSVDNFSIVWLQGHVLAVSSEDFLLNDSTGIVQILRANIPSACPTPCTGRYMMVIGQLEGVSNGVPSVRATKVQDLSSNTVLQTLWAAEVKDLRLMCLQ